MGYLTLPMNKVGCGDVTCEGVLVHWCKLFLALACEALLPYSTQCKDPLTILQHALGRMRVLTQHYSSVLLICRALGQAVCIAYKHTCYASLTPEATDWFRSKG